METINKPITFITMKKTVLSRKFLSLLAMSLVFFACDRNGETPEGKYNRGVFVINEGGFGRSNGTIDFINPTTGELESDIFGLNNNNRPTGDVIQDLRFAGEKGFIIANGSNKIEEVTVESFINQRTWESQLRNPRYMVTNTSGEFGYISNWGSFDESFNLDQSYVAIADLVLGSVIDTVHTDPGSENVFFFENTLYVSNSFTNTVFAIDVIDRKVKDTIEVGNSPKGLAVAGNSLWVLCQGDFGANNSTLHRISLSNNELTRTIELNMRVQGSLVLNAFENKLYYTSGKSVFATGITDTAAPSAAEFEVTQSSANLYGIGYNGISGRIWVCDPGDFSSSGKVFEYDRGELKNTYTTGIAPNGVRFR
jgi:YVTN family beta-propeller protein